MKLKQKPTMEIRNNEYFSALGTNRKVKQLVMRLYDLRFTADINDDRDAALAERLASDLNVTLLDFTK